jgi:hypothetical protein
MIRLSQFNHQIIPNEPLQFIQAAAFQMKGLAHLGNMRPNLVVKLFNALLQSELRQVAVQARRSAGFAQGSLLFAQVAAFQ